VLAEAGVRCKTTTACVKRQSDAQKKSRGAKKSWFSSGTKETQEQLLARLEGEAIAGVTDLISALLRFMKMNAKGYVSGLVAIRRAYKELSAYV